MKDFGLRREENTLLHMFIQTYSQHKDKKAFIYRVLDQEFEVTYKKLFDDVLILSRAFKAKKIAKVLIVEKLAACVQLSEIESFYNWNNEFCCDNETLLNIKTIKENFEKIKSRILELHSYDLPEIIQLDITNTSEEYLNFIKGNTI